jgi:hypothetical protein
MVDYSYFSPPRRSFRKYYMILIWAFSTFFLSSLAVSVSIMSTLALPPRTFYKRPLPDSCIALSSKEGKKIFASALANNGLRSFFALIEQL